MFSFFRKKQKQPEKPITPQNSYKQEYLNNPELYASEAAIIQDAFPDTYPKSKSDMINLLVQTRIDIERQMAFNELQRQKEEEARQQFLKQQENERAAYRLAEQEKQEAILKRVELRNQRLNNLTRKHGYKRKQNLINNVARQRGNWRGRNPNANYLSIENFANTNFFHPHSIYTGISNNNNASTITFNSRRSSYSNRPYSPFGGKRTRRRSHRKL